MRRIPIEPVLLLLVLGAFAAPAGAAGASAGEMERLRAAIFAVPPGQLVQVGEEVTASYRSPLVTEASLAAAAASASASTPGKSRPRHITSFFRVGGDPVRVWQQEIHAPDASYIAPHFSHFNLPGKSYLVVRAPDSSRSWSYSGTGKGELGTSGGFWGIHILGDTAVLELWADSPLAEGAVEVDRYARGYPPATGEEATAESLCGSDNSNWAKCYQTSEPTIYQRSRAVGRLLINGLSACTGWLVGDEGHLMTNAHCVTNPIDALNTDYELMAEGATCSTSCASWAACPGNVVASGALLIKTNALFDYTLVKLPINPVGTYGFLQMRTTPPAIDERIYIPGHPQAWGKRIAVFSNHPSDASGKCEIFSNNEFSCLGIGPDIGYFCDTQGGSSGSPVLAYADHAVVALHHCGGCPNTGVPITDVVTDLGILLPRNSTR